jgi:peptidoglycan/xylan/chitin deacetylase (PgdA/CDA1 family)
VSALARRTAFRHGAAAAAVVAVALMLAPATSGAGRASPDRALAAAAVPVRTVVSLEFDHAFADTLPSIELAAADGIHVTLFAMSGRLNLPGYLGAAPLRTIQAWGDEIGGHTIDHPDLSKLTPSQQRYEICTDRSALEADGLLVTDFAYPFGHAGPATPGIVRGCGYASARGAGGISSPGGCYGPCPLAETIPPADLYMTRTANSILDTTPLSTIEADVTRAEQRGGWIQIVFHHVCDACDLYAVSPAILDRFLAWLAPRARRGTITATVWQALHLRVAPAPVRAGPGRRELRRLRPRGLNRLAAGRFLAVVTGAPAISVRVVARTSRAIAATKIGASGRRWRLRLRPAARTESALLEVRYPLGLAVFRVRIARS